MPFVRRKRGQVLVVHNRRSPDGKVQQEVLHSFAAPEELTAVLAKDGWSRWKEAMAWQHPDHDWDWPRLKRRLAELRDSWGGRPTGAVARRENRVQQLATDLDSRLRRLTGAGPADAVVLDGARDVLSELRGTLDRLLEPKQGRGDPHPAGKEKRRARPNRHADHLFDQGMEHWWAGDRRTACRWFKKALEVHPGHADAHNHLGIACFDKGQLAQAEGHFVVAIESGSQSLVQEAGKVAWGFLENRPYLRSLANLALVRHGQRRYDDEVEIYERILRMNPNDNQGVRWLLGEGYHRLGRLDVAIKAYEAALEEPGCCYSLALALHESRNPEAGLALVRAFAANRYIAPMLLGERWERIDAWHGSNMVEPEYVERQGDLWRAAPGSRDFLRRWWTAEPVRRWLDGIEQVMREMDGLEPGDKRSMLVSRLHGMRGDGNIRIVARDVDPESTGGLIPTRRPHVATLDDVRISRKDGYGIIEYLDSSVGGVHLKLDGVEAMSDEEILEAHNDVIESMNEARAAHVYHPVEVPPGKPQIEYCPESDQWVPRGHVLRCVVHDWDREARVVIDGRELTQAEFGRLLTTFSGWGMRIVFVADDELTEEPTIEVKDPDEPEPPGGMALQPWIPGGQRGPRPSA
jgi:tetratricopeptide (TPR) repeat protein